MKNYIEVKVNDCFNLMVKTDSIIYIEETAYGTKINCGSNEFIYADDAYDTVKELIFKDKYEEKDKSKELICEGMNQDKSIPDIKCELPELDKCMRNYLL